METTTALATILLESYQGRFRNVRELGEGALRQVRDDEWHRTIGANENSVAVIIQHLHGNMLSRWTDFLTTDGEKPARNRDGEFEEDPARSSDACLALWNEGWHCLESALESLAEEDLTKTIYIRQQPLSALDAINRQLSHCSYHVGQIVQLTRHFRGEEWQTLSIARGRSSAYKARPND